MSAFETEWLDLRERADREARDPDLLLVATRLAGQADHATIADLGCGTGALMRAFAGRLPDGFRWRLVDADPRLLDAARRRAGPDPPCEFVEADIADVEALPLADVGLVTASALFDLVSAGWAERLGDVLDACGIPLYAALSYSGTMTWSEPSDLDGAILAAFNTHQRRDKGFGPALGPAAPETLERLFRARGFTVRRADSPWALHAEDTDLHRALVRGIAHAAAQAGMHAGDVAAWLAFREDAAGRSQCRVGHADLLAVPRAEAY